jgi:hypothetical protein
MRFATLTSHCILSDVCTDVAVREGTVPGLPQSTHHTVMSARACGGSLAGSRFMQLPIAHGLKRSPLQPASSFYIQRSHRARMGTRLESAVRITTAFADVAQPRAPRGSSGDMSEKHSIDVACLSSPCLSELMCVSNALRTEESNRVPCRPRLF